MKKLLQELLCRNKSNSLYNVKRGVSIKIGEPLFLWLPRKVEMNDRVDMGIILLHLTLIFRIINHFKSFGN